jgi:hypothetical protein
MYASTNAIKSYPDGNFEVKSGIISYYDEIA